MSASILLNMLLHYKQEGQGVTGRPQKNAEKNSVSEHDIFGIYFLSLSLFFFSSLKAHKTLSVG
jgi:hypothetical protein